MSGQDWPVGTDVKLARVAALHVDDGTGYCTECGGLDVWPCATASILDEVEPEVWVEARAERERAHAKHGDKSMESWGAGDYARLSILMEEVGEVAREFNEAELGERDPDLTALRGELIQVAAMAGAWADACVRPGIEEES